MIPRNEIEGSSFAGVCQMITRGMALNMVQDSEIWEVVFFPETKLMQSISSYISMNSYILITLNGVIVRTRWWRI
jgi:hypothetical protein